MPDPGLMPLPDAAADLDWSNLVDAAKAYEGESADHPPGPRAGQEQCHAQDSLTTHAFQHSQKAVELAVLKHSGPTLLILTRWNPGFPLSGNS